MTTAIITPTAMNFRSEERRRFIRLEMTEAAIAVDDSGFQLGCVSQASGGGLLLKGVSEEAKRRMSVGTRLRITIVEPDSGASNRIKVEVRYIDQDSVGMQFI